MNNGDHITLTTDDGIIMNCTVVGKQGHRYKLLVENGDHVQFQFSSDWDLANRYPMSYWCDGYYCQYPLKKNHFIDCSLKKIS